MTSLPVIRGLVPPQAACHECPPGPDHPQLHPLEESQLAGRCLSEQRRKEFALGRWCARRAMAALSRGQEPLLTGPSRAPIWPQGLIGSITHCEEYCAAAVAETKDVAAIGIDAEPWRGFPLEIRTHVVTENEYSLSKLGQCDAQSLAVFFSVKESVFKALNPVTDLFFDFLSISVILDMGLGRFSLASSTVPQIASYGGSLVGQFVITDNRVLSCAYVLRR